MVEQTQAEQALAAWGRIEEWLRAYASRSHAFRHRPPRTYGPFADCTPGEHHGQLGRYAEAEPPTPGLAVVHRLSA